MSLVVCAAAAPAAAAAATQSLQVPPVYHCILAPQPQLSIQYESITVVSNH